MTAPDTRTERRRRLARALGYDRMGMFVPAVMSVGLVFWIVSELRDLARSQRDHQRERRARITAVMVADRTTGRTAATAPPRRPEELGLRPRPVYLLLTAWLVGVAIYVAVGSVANYLRPGGYVGDIAWLLALSLGLSSIAALYGGAALVAFARHPALATTTRRLTVGSPLTTDPTEPGALAGRPHWALTAALAVSAAASAVLALLVAWSPHVVRRLDDDGAGWLAAHPPAAWLTWLDPVGTTEVAIALTVVGALAAVRCRVVVSTLVLALGTALAISVTVRPLVARPRPGVGALAGALGSFPSGHVLLGTVLAGLLPLALGLFVDRRSLVAPGRALLGAGVVAAAAHRVATGVEWPTDALGGALFGITLVLVAEWAVRTERSHVRCRGCPWGPAVAPPHHAAGLVPFPLDAVHLVRLAAHLTAAGAALTLAVLTFTVDVPTNPEGPGFGTSVERPVQLALAGVVSLAALAAWKWPAPAAVAIAFAGTALGVFASVEYRPAYAVALAGGLLVPAVLLWLGWQHRRRHGEIVALASVTAVLLGGTWIGSDRVYDHFYGPTHPSSTTAAVAEDRVTWVWSGALTPDGVTVSTRLAAGRERAVVVATPEPTGPVVRSAAVVAGEHRIAPIRLDGLTPGTTYRYVVEVDGVADVGRGTGRFRTPAAGPTSFRLAVASCARTGSNGSVYDAIAAADPLLYLQLGDLHYQNLTATDPGPFLDAYDRVLTAPAQAALAREVPMAYVWDDHDFGPNDAGADSPTRGAVRAAYDLAVPHYPLDGTDGPINQAFTIGRVRVVVTDGRSGRTGATLLGAAQEAWLVRELTEASRTHALVVWANATPWIGTATPGSDTWAGYAAERTRIADALAAAGVDDLVMVSGDAHMVALDDGTNSGYATRSGPGFPVLQAAPLDRPASVKGGPYSEGTFPGAGQFGLVDITDTGGTSVTVRLSGHTWDGRELVAWERTIAVPAA